MVYQGWTATWQMFLMNIAVGAAMMALFPLLPKADVNKRIPMAGSRFNPLPGEHVVTGPVGGLAREDDPVRGLAGSAFASTR